MSAFNQPPYSPSPSANGIGTPTPSQQPHQSRPSTSNSAQTSRMHHDRQNGAMPIQRPYQAMQGESGMPLRMAASPPKNKSELGKSHIHYRGKKVLRADNRHPACPMQVLPPRPVPGRSDVSIFSRHRIHYETSTLQVFRKRWLQIRQKMRPATHHTRRHCGKSNADGSSSSILSTTASLSIWPTASSTRTAIHAGPES